MLNWKILLASQSPRRRSLIQGLDMPVELVDPPGTDESFPVGMDPYKVPLLLADRKSLSYKGEINENEVLVTADTIVLCKGKIINKPANSDAAREMLRSISGCWHTVITAVCLKTRDKNKSFSSTTEVYINNLDDDEIDYYVDKYQPLDKAGAYGIQEWIGYIGVERIKGSFFNVMGLPLHSLYRELKTL